MLKTRLRWKRAPWRATRWHQSVGLMVALALVAFAVPAPAAVAPVRPEPAISARHTADLAAFVRARTARRAQVRAHRDTPSVRATLAAFTPTPTRADDLVVTLIHQDFPRSAWHDAETVAWCESKFRARDIGFDSNGTHDRGLFQLNDGGTEQYLLQMLGHNPDDLDLALNPVVNVRAAALLYHRDGWHPWSCASAI